jgi:hypothetical protein
LRLSVGGVLFVDLKYEKQIVCRKISSSKDIIHQPRLVRPSSTPTLQPTVTATFHRQNLLAPKAKANSSLNRQNCQRRRHGSVPGRTASRYSRSRNVSNKKKNKKTAISYRPSYLSLIALFLARLCILAISFRSSSCSLRRTLDFFSSMPSTIINARHRKLTRFSKTYSNAFKDAIIASTAGSVDAPA